jgi:hypothetical protein
LHATVSVIASSQLTSDSNSSSIFSASFNRHCFQAVNNFERPLLLRPVLMGKATADAACESLDKEIGVKREEGALEAGISTSVRLEWTLQTQEVVRVFEAALKADVRT